MSQNNLLHKYKSAGVLIKLIVINIAVFVIFGFFGVVGKSKGFDIKPLFALPAQVSSFLSQPWSILTYSFLHKGIWHIGMNMFMLYWVGEFVLNIFKPRKFLTIYLLGALFGGLFFLLIHALLPTASLAPAPVVGASGSIMAILVFIAVYAPQTEVRIIKFNIKLWHIAVFFVVFDLIRIADGSSNTGGLLVHLGSAAFGYFYAKELAKGNDIGLWFEKLMDGMANFFKPRKEKPFKKVHRNKTTQNKSKRSKPKETKSDHQIKIDAILDKIGKSGYESLTKAEKDFLFKAGNNN